ncbi:SMI1/KNR4 family protein [Kitasatospora sp. NRRL B-11411]|uniref:SMI1/KNR4 family protein n=1 Tax=Kitasatospora sp. NRRL B-11411 TaxID=1463822 RepID=UPI00068B9723|nr:SMI1/KNR4 family protein [Kitasatospora sp. NRRL B-11411]
MERLERDVRAILARLARSAPEGWTELRLETVDSRYGPGTHGRWTLPDGNWHGLRPDPEDLDALAAAIAAERGWPRARLHLEHDPAGPYTLTATPEPRATRGRLLVLDPDYVHPAPGLTRPGSVLPPAGDPERAVALLAEYRRRTTELTGHRRPLGPPLTPGQIEEAERRLGHRLPDDLRALYLAANGSDVMANGLWLGHLRWLPLDEVVRAHAHWAQYPHRPDPDRPDLVRVMDEPGPLDTVRRCLNHPGWIPFATADDGNYHAVDLAPAEHGRPGQVIESGRDFHDGPLYVADSVTSLLAAWLDLIDRGAYEIEDAPEDGEEIDPEYPPGLEVTESVRPPGVERSVLGPGLPAAVAPTLQRVLAVGEADEGPLDLAPLAAAPGLRVLRVRSRTVTGLGALRPLPVEFLRAGLDGEGLAPLAGHPRLGALDLACDTPLDLAPLRTLPALWWLDLSRCAVEDLRVLRELAGLRYLALTDAQWAELLQRGALPPALAVARLADGSGTAAELRAWADRFAPAEGEPCHVSGTLAVGG